MTSSDLVRYFSESLENQTRLGIGPGKLSLSETPAILYSSDEVRLDSDNSVVWIPNVGDVQIDLESETGEVHQFDWAALVKDGLGWSVIFGQANPYIIENACGLPIINGAVIAVPAVLNANFEDFSNGPLLRGEEGVMTDEKLGRNGPCFCGSGRKYKKCCLQ